MYNCLILNTERKRQLKQTDLKSWFAGSTSVENVAIKNLCDTKEKEVEKHREREEPLIIPVDTSSCYRQQRHTANMPCTNSGVFAF